MVIHNLIKKDNGELDIFKKHNYRNYYNIN